MRRKIPNVDDDLRSDPRDDLIRSNMTGPDEKERNAMVTNDVLYEMARQKIGEQLEKAATRQISDEMASSNSVRVVLRLRRMVGLTMIDLGERIGGGSVAANAGIHAAG